MKQTKRIVAVMLILILSIALVGCNEQTDASSQDGVKKNITLNIKNLDNLTTLNIETTAETLYDALKEKDLIEGEKGQYGFFVTSVNGVTADGSDGTYWTFRDKDGEFFPTAVEATNIKDGDVINIVRE